MVAKTIPESRNAGAVLVIFILGLVLIMYILSISPEERENLLEQDSINSYDFKKVTMGYIYPDDRTYKHEIAPVNIIVNKNDEQIFSYKNLEIKQSIFYKQEFNLNTTLLKNFDYLNLLISFSEKIGPQDAYLIVNNKEIEFPNNLPVKSIIIPKEYYEGNNINIKIKFKNDYLNLFTKRSYKINEVSLVGTILDKTSSSTSRSFSLRPQEEQFLDTSVATFVVACSEDSIINIKLNDFTVLNEEISCKMTRSCNTYNGSETCLDLPLEKAYSLELPRHAFKYNQNELIFSLLKGKASVNKFTILNSLNSIPINTFEFSISDRLLPSNNINSNYSFYLEAKIQNYESRSNSDTQFDLYINGNKMLVETTTGILIQNITEYISKNNIVWIDSPDTLYVDYIKAYFE
ncbi:MAG: hypothetical protein PHT94_00300 [Candidatus Nanoarchaeia archaeon]|nr:hypothetical protein [Candidatus Nanoarchaeia archaeon]